MIFRKGYIMQELLYILLAVSAVQTMLIIILLVRQSKSGFDENEARLRQDISRLSEQLHNLELRSREEAARQAKASSDSTIEIQAKLMEVTNRSIERLRLSVEQRLEALQRENTRKLDEVRGVVDEKLNATLNTRLNESFKQVSERLEQVYKGLGEMQTLASGVGDLKKVLTNVKTRGTWGEIQLGNLLEQILSSQQYAKNVATIPGSQERVEFAVILPGQSEGNTVYLPIDAKFPQEDYIRLCEAGENGDMQAAEAAQRALRERIKTEAQRIHSKYISVPYTTDFGILYLPVEGLYAEIARQAELTEYIQRQHRIIIAGPTTLTALLNSLQMGFATLAIQKRSSEVWEVLGAFKTEFRRFEEILQKTKKKLQEAANTIDQAEVRTRSIGRKLRDVEELPDTGINDDLIGGADE